MEKIVWVESKIKGLSSKKFDGLEEVNRHLEEGWKVKNISAAATISGTGMLGQAYVVLEK